MLLLWYFILALGGLSSIALLTVAIRRWPAVAASAVLITVLIAWELPHPPALLSVAGVNVYFTDILCSAIFVIALSEWRSINSVFGGITWAWLSFGILLLVALVFGLAQNEIGGAFNEFRTFFYPYSAISWVLSQSGRPWFSDDAMGRFSLLLGWGLVLVAAYHVSIYGLGDTSEFVEATTGVEQTTRPLISGQAFMILIAALVVVQSPTSGSRHFRWFSSAVFLLVALFTQQRTVWAVGAISLLWILMIARPKMRLSIVVGLIVTVWVGSIALASGTLSGAFRGIDESAINPGTYDARVQSWGALIQTSFESGPIAVLFGAPMGSGFGRFEGFGRWVEFAPHNWYVTVYLRTGLIGLSCLLIFFLHMLTKLSRIRANPLPAATMLAVMVYGWSYSWLWYFCVFIGWALSKISDSEIQISDSEIRFSPSSIQVADGKESFLHNHTSTSILNRSWKEPQ